MQLLSDNLVTPNEIFFIRNHLPVPDIDENKYELEITGEGINTVTLSLEVIYRKLTYPTGSLTTITRSLKPRPNDSNISTQQYPNIVGPVFASSGQTIATFERKRSQHCWAQHVALVCPPCCNILRHVAS